MAKFGSGQPRYSICIHPQAEADLERLWESHEGVAAAIVAFLELVRDDDEALDQLTVDGFVRNENPRINVRRWKAQWNRRRKSRNLWRLRLLDLRSASDFRLIYAFDPSTHRYHVLGIMPREVDYDEQHPFVQRILDDYDALDIPGYP